MTLTCHVLCLFSEVASRLSSSGVRSHNFYHNLCTVSMLWKLLFSDTQIVLFVYVHTAQWWKQRDYGDRSPRDAACSRQLPSPEVCSGYKRGPISMSAHQFRNPKQITNNFIRQFIITTTTTTTRPTNTTIHKPSPLQSSSELWWLYGDKRRKLFRTVQCLPCY